MRRNTPKSPSSSVPVSENGNEGETSAMNFLTMDADSPPGNLPGRRADSLWEHFIKTPKMKNKTNHLVVCRHCLRAYQQSPQEAPEPVLLTGRKDVLNTHVKKCSHITKTKSTEKASTRSAQISSTSTPSGQKDNQQRQSEHNSTKSTDQQANGIKSIWHLADSTKADSMLGAIAPAPPPAKRQKVIETSEETVAALPEPEEQIGEFHLLLIEFIAANHLPFKAIEALSFRRLLQSLKPVSTEELPSKQVLKTTILEAAVRSPGIGSFSKLLKVQEASEFRVSVILVGWETVLKRPMLGVTLAFGGLRCSYDTLSYPGQRSSDTALADVITDLLKRLNSEGCKVGAIISTPVGHIARAQQTLALDLPRIAFPSCFAHDINFMAKNVLSRCFDDVAAQGIAMLGALKHPSAAHWLDLLRNNMIDCYNETPPLLEVLPNSWSSAQRALASLLRVRTAIRKLVTSNKGKSGFPQALLPAEDRQFWKELADVEAKVRPLALASFASERAEFTLGEALHIFGKLYRAFASTNDVFLKDYIEKQWEICEQPLYLLAYFLHPELSEQVRALSESAFTKISFLCDAAIFYYKRFCGEDYGQLRSEMFEWYRGRLTTVKAEEFPNKSLFWDYVKLEGNRRIAELASAVLSITINTTSCETMFSEWVYLSRAKRRGMNLVQATQLGLVRSAMYEKKKQHLLLTKDRRIYTKAQTRIVDSSELPARKQGNAATSDAGRCRSVSVDEEESFAEAEEGPPWLEAAPFTVESAHKLFKSWIDVISAQEGQDALPSQDPQSSTRASASSATTTATAVASQPSKGSLTTQRAEKEQKSIQDKTPPPQDDSSTIRRAGKGKRTTQEVEVAKEISPLKNGSRNLLESELMGLRGQKITLARLFGSHTPPLCDI